MADSTLENKIETRPYKPSWIDRFTDWVEKLPVRKWIFYAGLGLFLLLMQVVFLWLDGGLQFDVLLPIIIFNALLIPYLLALIHLLDNQAVMALNSMRPTLDITQSEFDDFQYKLSTMPSLATFITGLTLMISLVLSELLWLVPDRYAVLDDLSIFKIVYQIIDKFTPLVFGPFIYHTIAQLRFANTIYTNHARINLFDLKPLYAFSKLTASTATGLIFPVYGWMLLNPELLTNPVGLGGMVVFTILAVVVFVWPLVGAHHLMEREKERILHDIDLRFETVFTLFNQRFHRDDYSAIERLNGTISSLEIQQRKIKVIPTWPWRPGTVRTVFTAIGLPLVLMIIQILVQRAFKW